MSAYLKSGDNNIFVLYKKTITIGKDNSCDLNLTSPVVEEKHAVLEYSDVERSFVLTDLNSKHGTFVNGCLVRNSNVRLSAGDIIKFDFVGPEYELCFAELPKVLPRTLSVDQQTIKHSLSFPPIGSSVNSHLPVIQPTSRPSSSQIRKITSPTAVPPVDQQNTASLTSLRRALSQDSLTASRERFKTDSQLQHSHSGDETIFQAYIEQPEKPSAAPQLIRHQDNLNLIFSPRETAYDFRFLLNPTSGNSSPRTSRLLGTPSGEQTNYRFTLEQEVMDKHNELRNLTEHMHDLKTVDQDSSAAKLQTFLELREKEARMVRDELNRFQRDKKVLSDILSQMAKDLINKDAAFKIQEKNLQEKESVIKTYVRGLQSKEEFILEQVRSIQQKDEVLREQAKRLNEKDEVIRRLEKNIRDKDSINQRHTKEISDKDNIIHEQKSLISVKDENIADQKDTLETKDRKLKKHVEDLKHKEDVIKAQTKCLLDKEERITELSKNWDDAERNILELERNIREKDDTLSRLTIERDRLAGKVEGTKGHLIHMFKLYMETSGEPKSPSIDGGIRSFENADVDNILLVMEETMQRELESAKNLKAEADYLSHSLSEEREAKQKLETELSEALITLENLRVTTEETITSLELMNAKFRENVEAMESDKNDIDQELASIKDKCRQLEETEKELRQKVTDTEFELDSFRRQVTQTTFAIPGTIPPTGPISTRSIVAAIEQLATERNEMSRKIAELKGALRQQKLTIQEENLARKVLKDVSERAEESMKLKGRWQLALEDAINKIQGTTTVESHDWIKEIILEIYRRENRWQTSIEETLSRCDVVIQPDCNDCGQVIFLHHTVLTNSVLSKENAITELNEEFEQFKNISIQEKNEIEAKLKDEAEENIKRVQIAKNEEMQQMREEMQKKAEEELRERVQIAEQTAQLKAEEEKELITAEKNSEMEKLKEQMEENKVNLEQKEDTIRELSEKLELVQQELEGKSMTSITGEELMENETNAIDELRNEINKLNMELESKSSELETAHQKITELQEKSNQLMAERTRRPSSVPGSRKGRYAMNLERLVQNLSIENASFKLQLDQRDSIVQELRNQIGALKLRHLPANLAELQQRETNELLEQLQSRDTHIENLMQNMKKMMEDINKREMVINQQEEEIRMLHEQHHTSQTQIDVNDIRRLTGDEQKTLMNGYDESPTRRVALMPSMHEVFRCRYCKHDRGKLLTSARQTEIAPTGLNILHTKRIYPSSLSPETSRRSTRKSTNAIRSRSHRES